MTTLENICRVNLIVILVHFYAFGSFFEIRASSPNDFREICRKSVASKLISLYDEINLAKKHQVLSNEVLVKLKKKSEEIDALLQKEKKQESKLNPFEHSEGAVLSTKKQELVRTMSQQKILFQKYKSQEALKTTHFDSFKKRVEQVFIIETSATINLGYSLNVKWKTMCPQFETNCKLNSQDSMYLNSLIKDLGLHTTCRNLLSEYPDIQK